MHAKREPTARLRTHRGQWRFLRNRLTVRNRQGRPPSNSLPHAGTSCKGDVRRRVAHLVILVLPPSLLSLYLTRKLRCVLACPLGELCADNSRHQQARSPPREIIGPSAVPAEDASGVNEIVEDSDWRKVPGTHIQVRFGDGAAVQEVMTAFDSMRVLLDNLPPDVTESDIRPLVDSFGQLADVTVFGLDPTGKHASAVVEFDSCLSALNAATALNEIVVSSASGAASPCIASVQARAGERGAATLRSNSVRLTWHAPSRLAYAHYATTKRAKWNAERLDGMSFDHRKITASFQKPKWNQESSFTVVLANLPLDAPCDHLQRFAHADSVTLGKVSYEEYPAIVSIRSALMQYGGLESLETHPSTARSTKVKALARFATPSAAEEATLALHGRPQSFLGNGPLWIERVYSIKYTASRPQYEALKHDISMLQAVDPKENPARIRVYDVDAKGLPVDSVMVRVYCSEPKPLGKLKAVVERVLAGERWVNESGAGVWDDCFSTAVGEELLAAANATGNGFARRDVHRRSIHMYGSDEGRAFLRFHISEGLDTVRSRRQTVAVDKAMMRHLVTGGFARIQDEYGIDNVTLNVAARTLEVRSDDVDSALIQRLLHDPSTVPAFEPAIATAECPICFCQVTKPMTLLCGHVYCTACVQHYMTSAAHSDEFPVKCLGEEGSCGIAIPSKDLERLLKPDDEEAMMQSSFLSFVRAHPNEYRYCPTPDCPELYRPAAEGTVLQCPSCLGKVCPACHQEFHEGSSCAEYREAQAGLGGDESFRLWRLKNFVQPCPGCGMLLDKISGCNHVVCGVCKTHMCWKCMGVFAAGEIYEHMSRAHGREGMYA